MKLKLTILICLCFHNIACFIPEEEVRIVLLPDTQIYSESFPEIFHAQTKWIASQAGRISFVLHQGDITNNNSDEQWEVAAAAMRNLEEKEVPYAVCMGNHDIGTHGFADVRNTDLFNKWFPYSKHSTDPHFGGAFEYGKMDNVWYTFQAGGIAWLVLSLEFGPRNKVLDWAAKVIEKHDKHKVIINTHAFMYADDTRMSADRDHQWLPQSYGLGKAEGDEAVNNGEQMWDKLVSRHANILFVFSGHVLFDGVGTLVSEGVHGNLVYQMLANYQSGVEGSENGGNGFLRILTINPRHRTVSVQTYSPYLDVYKSETHQEFTFKNVAL